MPHTHYNTGSQSANGDFAVRPLIPGVEPGGSRAGRSKPALLIRNMEVSFLNVTPAFAGADFEEMRVNFKMSQDVDMDPGLVLRVADMYLVAGGAATGGGQGLHVHKFDYWRGTLWAPAYTAIQLRFGGPTDADIDLMLDYEVVQVPWQDWFIMWEFLDNVVNDEQDY